MTENNLSKMPLLPVVGMGPPSLLGFFALTEIEQDSFFQALGERSSLRVKQIHRWFIQGVTDFRLMTDIPAGLRGTLVDSFVPFSSKILLHSKATDETEKLLLEFPDK